MPLWSRRRALPAEIETSWAASRPPEGSSTAMAASPTVGGWVVLSSTHLSVQDGDGAWSHTAWHEIEHGGWNTELVRLQWTRTDGRRGSVHLAEPGAVPGVFRERVKSSIVFQTTVPYTDTGGIVVSARRDLAHPSAPLRWNTTLHRGLSWSEPGLREFADQALARYRAEFDTG